MLNSRNAKEIRSPKSELRGTKKRHLPRGTCLPSSLRRRPAGLRPSDLEFRISFVLRNRHSDFNASRPSGSRRAARGFISLQLTFDSHSRTLRGGESIAASWHGGR